MTGEIPDEESKDTVSNKPAAKDKKNKMMDWIWKDSPITRIIEKFITSGARRVTNTPTFRSGMK